MEEQQQYNSQQSYENISNKVKNIRDSPNISSFHCDESTENKLQQINKCKGGNLKNDDEEQQLQNKSKQTQEECNIYDEEKKQIENLQHKPQNEYLYNYQPLQNSTSNQQNSKIKIGLPNIGMTCYINSAVQQLRQFYYIDNTIFATSNFGQRFKELFNHLENRNQEQVYNIMEYIVQNAKQQQNHQLGGDAYICINNFLKQIRQDMNTYCDELEFDNKFLLKYSDQLYCSKCKNNIQHTKDQFTFHQYEEFGQECNSLSDAFSEKGDQTMFLEVKSDIICDYCEHKVFLAKREYQVAPNFRMIRLLQPNQQPWDGYNNNNLFEQQFDLMVKGQQQKYEIIGFCNHYLQHYKYFAKYDSEWIVFNDNFTYSLPYVSHLDYSKALYFVFKKVQNNLVKSEKNQQLPNSKQIDVTNDRYSDKNSSKSFNRNDQIQFDSSWQKKQVDQDSNMSKQRNNHNENYHQNIYFGQKQENNQQFQEEIDKDIKLKKFEKVCKMLPDLENKQYIIIVLQTIFQIYYFFNGDLFDPSTREYQQFQQLIYILEVENIEEIKNYFLKILKNPLQNKKYQKSKEAYSYFCDFLYDITINQEPQLKNNLRSNFFIKYNDLYQCQKCQFYITTEQQFDLQQQDLYNQMLIDDSFNELPTQYKFKECYQCKKGYCNQKRQYLETPNFIIINQDSQEFNEGLTEKLNNIFQLNLYNNKIQKYQIIGFCSYKNQDYSYTIKYEDYWIKIYKKYVYREIPNCSNAQYFVLQKLTQQ